MILRPAARAAHSLTLLAVVVGGVALGEHSSGPQQAGGMPSSGASSAIVRTARVALAAGPRHRVGYHGVSVEVPSAWPVVDLDDNPTACVRMDHPVVYLGTPASDQQCPAHLVGGADTVWLAPTSAADRSATTTATREKIRGGRSVRSRWDAASGTGVSVVEASDVTVRTTSASGSDPADALVGSIAVTGSTSVPMGAGPATQPSPVTATPAAGPAAYVQSLATAAPSGKSLTGMWFDTCAAPSASTMSTWKASSPYAAVGVYIGGPLRGCGQPNLTSSWVSTVTRQGWGLVPIYVGYQAPCVQAPLTSFTAGNAASVGTSSAVDAAAKARALGLAAGSTIQYDLENYATGNTSCSAAVLTMVSAWTTEIRRQGFAAGVYGNVGSLMTDMSSAVRAGSASFTAPDQVWYALWDGLQTTRTGRSSFPDSYWAGQRHHQYRGDFTETWGGVSLQIDASWSAAPIPGNPTQVNYGTAIVGPGSAGFTFTGGMTYWRPSPGLGAMGRAYWTHTAGSTSEGNGATWLPSLGPGLYAVDVSVPAAIGANGTAHYTATDATGTRALTLDQSGSNGYRALLSSFLVRSGTVPRLHVGDNEASSTTEVIAADAARFRLVATTPDAPTAISASPADTKAVVRWAAADANGSAVTSYRVVASPGGAAVTVGGSASSATVGGLTDGVGYTFRVTATNVVGPGPASAASTAVVPTAAGRTTLVTPTRLVDTRYGTPSNPALKGSIGPNQSITLRVSGLASSPVPSTASAVLLQITAIGPTQNGRIANGNAGALTFLAGRTASNPAIAALDPRNGTVTLSNVSSGTLDLTVDVHGYLRPGTTGSLFQALPGAHLLDTTKGTAANPRNTPLGPGESLAVKVAGAPLSPVPSGARAVTMVITVNTPAADGSVRVTNSGPTNIVPVTFSAGRSATGMAQGTLDPTGGLTLTNTSSAPIQVSLDVLGYLATTGSMWTPLTASKLFDTRYGAPANPAAGAVPAGATVRVSVAGVLGSPVPVGAKSVAVSVTAFAPSRPGTVTLAPWGLTTRTSALSLNTAVTSNALTVVQVASDGTIGLRNNSAAPLQVVLDLQAYAR